MKERLNTVFSDLGLYVDEEEYDEELGLDSVTFVSLLIEIEEEFDIDIPDEKLSIEELKTFSDFLRLVSSQ